MVMETSKKALKIEKSKHNRAKNTFLRHASIPIVENPTLHLVILNGGLGNSVSREDLLKIFGEFKTIVNISMPIGKSYSFMSFTNVIESIQAKTKMNGIQITRSCVKTRCKIYVDYVNEVPGLSIPSTNYPPGFFCFHNFITPEEEEIWISKLKWDDEIDNTIMKNRQVQHFGYEFLYSINNVQKDSPLKNEIPEFCKPVINRILDKFPNLPYPDQLTINKYEPGQGIPPHIDTHSAFEDGILIISLGSQIVMDFKHTGMDSLKLSVLLPRYSLTVLTDESRYCWSHGIVPRNSDIIYVDNMSGLTLTPRSLRISFTFRKVLKLGSKCCCKWKKQCDDQVETTVENIIDDKTAILSDLPTSVDDAIQFEKQHVKNVYENIADHYTLTRHKPWEKVVNFLTSISKGSIIADIGCGNGYYLLNENINCFKIGCDVCKTFCDICNKRKLPVFIADALNIPLKTGSIDAVISIAVIHHFVTENRRISAINEIIRILRKGGKALISVWALEQERNNEKSKYLKKCDLKDINQENMITPSENVIPVHKNRTNFSTQDLFVPWNYKNNCNIKKNNVFNRFYHVFHNGELESLIHKSIGIKIIDSYYDQGNWCVILEKS